MGFRGRFVVGLVWRAGLFVGTGVLCLWALFELWRYIRRTNVELARFLEAVRLGDLSPSFSHGARGSGFGEIGEALDSAIRALREESHRLSDASRFYEAVLDDAPTPLLTVGG